jgi:hypothetical protein
MQIAKDASKRVGQEKKEEWDYWFHHLRPMTKPKQTWWEKRLAKEEGGSTGDNSGEEASKVTPTEGKTTQDRVTGTQNQVVATRSWETTTQSSVPQPGLG